MGINLNKYHDEKNNAQAQRRPFLKKTDLPKGGKVTTATVVDLREVEMEYSDLCLDVKVGKKDFTVGIKSDAVILSQLIRVLGKNTDKWRGKKIGLYLAKEKYINVEE